MQNIPELRNEIDQLHHEMAVLFRKRLALVKQVWEIKKIENLPLIDEKRELEMIHLFDSLSSQESEKIALQNFFRSVLAESKKYLEMDLK